MKRFNLLTALLLLTNWSYSQWITRHIDNGLDKPYRIAYCEDVKGNGFLKLEESDYTIAFYVTGGYHCSEKPIIDLAFKVKDEYTRYTIVGKKSRDSKTVFIIMDLTEEEQKNFLNDFLNASSMVMRINEETCTDDYYAFDMTNSTKAFYFMRGK